MTRRSPDQIKLARARAELLCDGAHPRVAARSAAPVAGLTGAPSEVILALADRDTRSKITGFAVAAYHAGSIAQAISGAARAELSTLVTSEARSFALSHRNLAPSAEIDTTLAESMAETTDRVETEIALMLKDAEPQFTTERHCLKAALGEVIQ